LAVVAWGRRGPDPSTIIDAKITDVRGMKILDPRCPTEVVAVVAGEEWPVERMATSEEKNHSHPSGPILTMVVRHFAVVEGVTEASAEETTINRILEWTVIVVGRKTSYQLTEAAEEEEGVVEEEEEAAVGAGRPMISQGSAMARCRRLKRRHKSRTPSSLSQS